MQKSVLMFEKFCANVNCMIFSPICRNESIIHACASHLDEKAAEVVKTMFALSENKSNRLSPTTNAVSHNEIFQNIRQSSNIKAQVSHYSYNFHF